jgi:methionyl-tRNA formyltransferase
VVAPYVYGEVAAAVRIVFMGATSLGWECCRTLLGMGEDVVGIFSIPREFAISWSPGRVTNVLFKSFEELASAHAIPLCYVRKKPGEPEYERELRQLRPDLIVVIGWYYMVPRSWRDAAGLGAVGVHASLLPSYRGGAPLVWAMINGETKTGVSLFHLADGIDEGDVIAQTTVVIGDDDNIAAVLRSASVASQELVRKYVPLLRTGSAPRHPQDHSKATVMPQRRPEDGLILWESNTARQVYNWVRAQTRPYPGAFTYLRGKKITIWKVALLSLTDDGHGVPGEIVPVVPSSEPALAVRCADGKLVLIREVELPDGSVLNGGEFATVGVTQMGDRFGERTNEP